MKASLPGVDVRPAVHVHPHVGRWRRQRTTTLSWVGTRRRVRSGSEHLARQGRADEFDVSVHAPSRRRVLGDPQPRRPGDGRHRLPDAEHDRRRRRVQRRQQLHASRRPAPWRATRCSTTSSMFRPARRRSRSTSTITPRPVPARCASCASIRTASASTRTRASTATRRLCRDESVQPARAAPRRQPQAGRLGGDGRGPADVRRRRRAVHADDVDPRRDRVAQPGRHRRPRRSAFRSPVSYTADQPVRRLHRTDGRHDARQRDASRRPRSPTSRSSSTRSPSPRDRRVFGRRSAAPPIQAPTSTCSSSTARRARVCSPGSRRTATPRNR